MVGAFERWHVVADGGPEGEGSVRASARAGHCVRGQASTDLFAAGSSGSIIGASNFSGGGTSRCVQRKRRCSSEPPLLSSGVNGELSVPVCVRSDLEDFFEQFDLRWSSSEMRGGCGPMTPSPGLTASELARLQRIRLPTSMGNRRLCASPAVVGANQGNALTEASCSRGFSQSAGCEDPAECVVCLGSLCEGELLLEMPCDGRHRLHEPCARTWLTRSAACPLCRVDVRSCIRTAAPDNSKEPLPMSFPMPMPGRGLAYTRKGGILRRFEACPLPTWERPVYIAADVWHLAQYFEVSYPGFGEVRVWRVPGLVGGDLVAHEALPLVADNHIGGGSSGNLLGGNADVEQEVAGQQ